MCEHALTPPHVRKGQLHHDQAWLVDLPEDELRCIAQRLQALPLAIEVETSGGPVGLVHGDFPGDDWRAIDTPLTEDEVECCLWSSRRFFSEEEVLNVRALIHGHLTLASAKIKGRTLFIDSGGWMVGNGHFTFVDLASLELIRGPGPNASNDARRNR